MYLAYFSALKALAWARRASATCNELRASDAGKTVRLSGWMFRLRDHGGILFVDLRDHYGLTQIVVHPSRSFFGLVEKAHLESVITVTGEVKLRTPDTINPELPTGEIEIEANELVMESASQVTKVRLVPGIPSLPLR